MTLTYISLTQCTLPLITSTGTHSSNSSTNTSHQTSILFKGNSSSVDTTRRSIFFTVNLGFGLILVGLKSSSLSALCGDCTGR